LRYALTGGGSLGESYVATGGHMRSDPALAVSDTIVVMVPELVTRSGVGFRLTDLFPERHRFTVMVGSGRPLSRSSGTARCRSHLRAALRGFERVRSAGHLAKRRKYALRRRL
jgi:hypothetical protein